MNCLILYSSLTKLSIHFHDMTRQLTQRVRDENRTQSHAVGVQNSSQNFRTATQPLPTGTPRTLAWRPSGRSSPDPEPNQHGLSVRGTSKPWQRFSCSGQVPSRRWTQPPQPPRFHVLFQRVRIATVSASRAATVDRSMGIRDGVTTWCGISLTRRQRGCVGPVTV
jgi:hypothetical protein